MLKPSEKRPSQFWDGEWSENPQRPIATADLGNIPMERLAGKSVLEIGCGASVVVSSVLRTGYTGMDISRVSLGLLQKYHGNLRVAVGDASALPFKDESFDTVIALETLTFLGKDFHKALDEMIRVSKESVIFSLPHIEAAREGSNANEEKHKDGGSVFNDYPFPHMVFSEDELHALLISKGLVPSSVMVWAEYGWRDYCTPGGREKLKGENGKFKIFTVAERE